LKVNEPLSGSEDWPTWRVQIEDWLDVNDVAEWIDEGSALSEQPNIQTGAVTVEPEHIANEKDVMRNIVSATSALDAWQRLRTSYQTADVVSLIRTRKYDRLRDIDVRHATPFDWGMVLASSLPDSWENFVQTIDLDALYDLARTEVVAKSIRSKILAEGQRRQNRDKEKGMTAKTGKKAKGKGPEKPKKECSFCKRKGHLESECWTKTRKDKEAAEAAKKKKGAPSMAAAKKAAAVDESASITEIDSDGSNYEDAKAAYAHVKSPPRSSSTNPDPKAPVVKTLS